jgi:hypothetical protein
MERLKVQAFGTVVRDSEDKVQMCLEAYFQTMSWTTKTSRPPSDHLLQIIDLSKFMFDDYSGLDD